MPKMMIQRQVFTTCRTRKVTGLRLWQQLRIVSVMMRMIFVRVMTVRRTLKGVWTPMSVQTPKPVVRWLLA